LTPGILGPSSPTKVEKNPNISPMPAKEVVASNARLILPKISVRVLINRSVMIWTRGIEISVE